jgi:hypothetical protein
MDWVGHALTVGMPGPEAARPPGIAYVGPKAVRNARQRADEFLEALQRFRYDNSRAFEAVPANPGASWQDLDNAVLASISEARDRSANALLIHVLSHGEADSSGLSVQADNGEVVPVAQWLLNAENHRKTVRPHTLFILDACYAGEAVRSSPIRPQEDPADDRVWIIASTRAGELAYNTDFTRAFTEILNEYASREVRFDGSKRFISLATVIADVQTRLDRIHADNGLKQKIEPIRRPPGEADDVPFFPNPAPPSEGDWAFAEDLDPLIVPMLDTIPGLRRAQKTAPDGKIMPAPTPRAPLQGRATELRKLTDWLEGEGGPLRIVTGKAGVGKSALIGVLVAAAHPRLRGHTTEYWAHLADKPHQYDGDFCVVHARGRGLPDIVQGICRQLGLGAFSQAEGLIRELTLFTGPAPVVVIDAVDESTEAEPLARLLLQRLATARRPDGTTGVCRLLVGCRPEGWFRPLIESCGPEACLDLDLTDRKRLRLDLRAYLDYMLQVGTYAHKGNAAIKKALIGEVSRRLALPPRPDEPPGCGEFLAAELFALQLRETEAPKDVAAARLLGARVPRSLDDLVDLHLSRQPLPWFRPLLAAVAHARGGGMPESLLREAMSVTRYGALPRSDADRPSLADLYTTLDAAHFYLRRAVEPDGRTLYRLFHHGLVERFRGERPPVTAHAGTATGAATGAAAGRE